MITKEKRKDEERRNSKIMLTLPRYIGPRKKLAIPERSTPPLLKSENAMVKIQGLSFRGGLLIPRLVSFLDKL